MASHSVTKLTEEQYLALDRAAEFKSEYFDGEMFAISGGSMEHARLQKNITGQLYNALGSGNCEPFGSDFRVRVSSRMYTYPDISVVCGKPLLADDRQDVLLNPIAIFEVLSPSTEKYDRGLKLQRYRTITSLQDYVLVNQNEIRIEQYTRQENNLWILRDYQSLDEELVINSIGVSLPLSRIYDRVEFPQPN
jgi:Uma2 family endonuclease